MTSTMQDAAERCAAKMTDEQLAALLDGNTEDNLMRAHAGVGRDALEALVLACAVEHWSRIILRGRFADRCPD